MLRICWFWTPHGPPAIAVYISLFHSRLDGSVHLWNASCFPWDCMRNRDRRTLAPGGSQRQHVPQTYPLPLGRRKRLPARRVATASARRHPDSSTAETRPRGGSRRPVSRPSYDASHDGDLYHTILQHRSISSRAAGPTRASISTCLRFHGTLALPQFALTQPFSRRPGAPLADQRRSSVGGPRASVRLLVTSFSLPRQNSSVPFHPGPFPFLALANWDNSRHGGGVEDRKV